jgi:hypothetical protein
MPLFRRYVFLVMNLSALCLLLTFYPVNGEAASFFTYDVPLESLACTSANCSSGSAISLIGTITTDGTGSLSASDIVAWDLSITLSGQSAIRLTQNMGSFSTIGSPIISATSSDLTITLNQPPDGFQFAGSPTTPASWLYGVSPPLETIFYNTSDGKQFYANRMLSLPSTFTASALAAVETPEPDSLSMAGLALLGSALFIAFQRLRTV